jgi:hypothetical protein
MTLAFENCFNLDLVLDIRIIKIERSRAKNYPVLLIIFLKLFRISTQINCRGTPVRIKSLQLLRPIILSAVIVDGDLPKV